MRDRLLLLLLVSLVAPAAAQQVRDGSPSPFTIDDVLSAPFPSSLVASADGSKIAWVGNEQGARNVWVAAAPSWVARKLTRFTGDEGQEIADLTFTADGRSLLYTRGGDSGGNWDETVPTNPTSDPRGTEMAVFVVPFAGGVPRRIGSGNAPRPSPAGDRVAFLYRDTVYVAPLRVAGPPRPMFRARGVSAGHVWSPDGDQLAFVSRRGSHSLIGVFDVRANTITWMAPSTSRDDLPRFSPDGGRIAFIRRPGLLYSTGLRAPSPTDPPPPSFRIFVADAASGEAREAYRSPAGADGAFPGISGSWGLGWASSDRLLFASELTGWIGLYTVPFDGRGEAARLTPTGCEVEQVVTGAQLDYVYYSANCDDIDRRHVFRVPLAGGAPQALTGGPGIEWNPVPLAGGDFAMLRSDARRPAAPAISEGGTAPRALEGWPLPATFPMDALVEPTAATVRTRDSVTLHLQIFAPPPGTPGRAPVVVFFHGGPQRQMLLGWHNRGYYHNSYAFNQYMASRGFLVVSVNYRGGIGYGRAFREMPRRGRNGASEYADVLAAAAYLRTRNDVDTTKVGLWGGSYGGYLTALGLARNSDLFAAGFDLHGVHDYAEDVNATSTWGISDSSIAVMRASSPVSSVDRWRSPVLLVAGDDDRNVHFQQTVDLARRLTLRGVDVQELIFPDEIHSFLRHANWVRAYRAGADFLVSVLRGGAAPR